MEIIIVGDTKKQAFKYFEKMFSVDNRFQVRCLDDIKIEISDGSKKIEVHVRIMSKFNPESFRGIRGIDIAYVSNDVPCDLVKQHIAPLLARYENGERVTDGRMEWFDPLI